MSESWFMKAPCRHCPFRQDVRPFLRVGRARQIAESTWNPYNEFHCHKTTVSRDDYEEGEMVATADSLACHGFVAMQINESSMAKPDGFEASPLIYGDPDEMVDAYQREEDGEWVP